MLHVSIVYAAWPRATASQWRQSSMTSFVLSPFADARTCLWKAIFDGFGGIWTSKCCRPSFGPPKNTSLRHNACFEPSRVKFHVRVTSVGESGKKIKIKIRKESFLTADWHKFWVACLSRWLIQLCDIAVNTVWTTVHTVIFIIRLTFAC